MTYIPTSPEDLAYVTRSFVPLAELCAHRNRSLEDTLAALAARRLPGPAYILADGTPMVAPDHFALVDEAGGVERLPARFAERLLSARSPRGGGSPDPARPERLTGADDIAELWSNYLDGVYAVCLRQVTPENIVRKEGLVRMIDAALAQAAPDDPSWRRSLRIAVAELDGLEREFAECDRARFGRPTSRDRCITGPRARYPWIFAP